MRQDFLKKSFDIFFSILNHFDIIYTQNKFFKQQFALNEAREIVLDYRIDQRCNSVMNGNVSVKVTETFQYVSLKGILLQLFNQTNLSQWLNCPQTSVDNQLRSTADSATKLTNPACFVELNIPQNFTSVLSNIFLLETTYMKKYGFDPFLRPFVEECWNKKVITV